MGLKNRFVWAFVLITLFPFGAAEVIFRVLRRSFRNMYMRNRLKEFLREWAGHWQELVARK
jgi:hypothetical protein